MHELGFDPLISCSEGKTYDDPLSLLMLFSDLFHSSIERTMENIELKDHEPDFQSIITTSSQVRLGSQFNLTD